MNIKSSLSNQQFKNISFLANVALALGVLLLASSSAVAATNDLHAVDDPITGRYCASTNGNAVSVDVLDNDYHAKITATSTTNDGEAGMQVDGDYAYVANYKFEVFNISDPNNSSRVASLSINADAQLRDVHIKGDYAYAADSGNDRMWVIDISDPSNPTTTGSVYFATDGSDDNNPWGAESVAMKGDYAIVLDNNPGNLISVDVSSSTNPQIVATTSATEIYGGKEVKVEGDYAYLVDYQNEVMNVFDVSDPTTLQKVGSVNVLTSPETLGVSGNYAYVGGANSGLQVVDVSSPSSPSVLNTVDLEAGDADVTSVHALENRVYTSMSAVDGSDDPNDDGQLDDIRALNITSPSDPEIMWAKELGDSPEQVYAQGEYVYTLDSGSSLLYTIDPDIGYRRIESYTQPDHGTVSLDDQGTSDETDDELVYSPSATGTDAFTYRMSGGPDAGAAVSNTATTSFTVQEEACEEADISISADPQDVTKYSDGTTTISWSYDNIHRCETKDGNDQWRNIDADASKSCSGDATGDSSCSGSDSAEITGIDTDTTFTLSCDTAKDGDDELDTSSSTEVTVTDLTACPFVEGSGDDEYDDVISIEEGIRSDYDADSAQTTNKSLSLEAGTYDVGMFIYDDHRGDESDRPAQNQEYEQAFARFSVDSDYADILQAENQATNTARYEDGSCGGSYSEQMECNGYIDFGTHPVELNDNSNPETIYVRARGESGEERLALLLDDTSVAEWDLTTDYDTYSYQPDMASDKNIKVEFVNDNGVGRDAQTDYVQIGSDPYDALTESTDDIPDDAQLGTTTKLTSVTIGEPTDLLQYRHHAYFKKDGSYGANSFTAACVGVDQKTSAPTTDISASTTSIDYNGTTTLDWTYSDVASGTTTSNTGNSQWANTSAIQPGTTCDPACTGSHSATIDNLTKDTTFTVEYDGAYGGTTSDSVAVDVADKPVDLNVDLDTVNVGGTTTLEWSTTGMDTCIASSNPTDDDWTTGRNPDPSGGTQELTDLSETTDYTLTCEDADGNEISDTATVVVRGFELTAEPQDIWGVQLTGSVTTQSKITIDDTSNFSDDVTLSASPVGGDIGAVYQFIDENGNVLTDTTLTPPEFDDGVWLQGQLGNNIKPGETTVEVKAEAVNSTTSASQLIDMHIRSIGEQ